MCCSMPNLEKKSRKQFSLPQASPNDDPLNNQGNNGEGNNSRGNNPPKPKNPSKTQRASPRSFYLLFAAPSLTAATAAKTPFEHFLSASCQNSLQLFTISNSPLPLITQNPSKDWEASFEIERKIERKKERHEES